MNAKESNVSKHYRTENYKVSFYKNGIFFYNHKWLNNDDDKCSEDLIGIY